MGLCEVLVGHGPLPWATTSALQCQERTSQLHSQCTVTPFLLSSPCPLLLRGGIEEELKVKGALPPPLISISSKLTPRKWMACPPQKLWCEVSPTLLERRRGAKETHRGELSVCGHLPTKQPRNWSYTLVSDAGALLTPSPPRA